MKIWIKINADTDLHIDENSLDGTWEHNSEIEKNIPSNLVSGWNAVSFYGDSMASDKTNFNFLILFLS